MPRVQRLHMHDRRICEMFGEKHRRMEQQRISDATHVVHAVRFLQLMGLPD